MPNPIALGLVPCERVITDRQSGRRSLIDVFSGLQVTDIKNEQEFSIFTRLTNGHGAVPIDLLGIDLTTGNQIYQQTDTAVFPDPLAVINLHVRLRLMFPTIGWYEFILQANGNPIAQQRIRVYS